MGSNEQDSASKPAGITVGKVIAGAAMAAGAILLAVAVFGEPSASAASTVTDHAKGNALQRLFDGIVRLFGHSDPVTGKFDFSSTGKVLAGAGLAGGGYALYSAMKSKEENFQDAQYDQVIENDRGDKWRAKIEMGAIRGKMMAAAALTDPAYFNQAPQARG